MSDRVARAAGKVSAAHRWKGRSGAPDLAEAEAELREARLERTILQALPGLTEEQRGRLANLLRSDVL